MVSRRMKHMTRKYDVFVSFQGDIRLNFRDHLFGAFRRKGIVAFRDEIMITKGELLETELIRAIEGSLVYVVVFSKNFAYSTWCLRELAVILQCVRVSRKRVFPIFYDVDPSEVRRQNVGYYAEAFAKHEERFKQELDMVQNWRGALTQVANLSGWDMRHKPQYEEIENMVKEIVNILGHKFSSLPKDVVGMHSPIEELGNLLLLDSVDDVRAVGITGMGGIGKSTLVTILYGTISHQFDACCFIDDVSKIYRHDGPIGVLQQILRQTLCEEPFQISNLDDATSLMRSRLSRARALIILDNVDQGVQLEKLAVDREWLGAGSRMIIISRDEHILKEYGVDVVYKVPLLNHANSVQLFYQNAFKSDYIMGDIMSDYGQLAKSILHYAGGLPLGIKVLGSFLFGQDISEWGSALARLRESPNNDIMGVLRLSFNGLGEMEKEIFLNIACFFVGMEEKAVKHILNRCGFHPDIGLRILIDKSLITSVVDYMDSACTVEMHDLLQELGKQIVQENSKKIPRKWSRVWQHKNLDTVVQENMEKNVGAIVLNHHQLRNIEGKMSIGETLSKRSHQRLLTFKEADLLGNFNCLSNELRYVQVHEYPFKCLPSSFHPNQLVDLQLPSSRLKQLWKVKKYLPNLTVLDLSHSKSLIMTPDFCELPNIEWQNLDGCGELVHLFPRKLVYLNVKDCKSLSCISNDIAGLSSLRNLDISGFSEADKNLSCISNSMNRLPFLDNLGGIHNIFVRLCSFKEFSKLVNLILEHCKYLKSLTMLPSLATISSDKYWRGREMYSFNCPGLVLMEHFSNMTSSWMIQFIRENQQSFSPFQYVDTIIPVCKRPRYFKNHRLGGSRIWMDPPPIMKDNDIIGAAYWVLFLVALSCRRRFLEQEICFLLTYYGKSCFNINSPVILDSIELWSNLLPWGLSISLRCHS